MGLGDALGLTEHHQAAGGQGEVAAAQHPLLQVAPEVDQDVAHRNEVDPGEGRIQGHVVPGEHRDVPQRARDLQSARYRAASALAWRPGTASTAAAEYGRGGRCPGTPR